MSETDWNRGTLNGHVTVHDHTLYMRATGPDRDADVPAVVCIAGLGDTSATWAAVHRHVSAFARVYSYDRAGLGSSDLSPEFVAKDKSYRNMAVELRNLLHSARIQPPYILVMHSMGSLPGREFLDLYPDAVAGLVFVDTITEYNHKSRPQNLPRVMHAMFAGLDRSFLWTVYKPEMTDDELREALEGEDAGDQAPPGENMEKYEKRQKAIQAEVENLVSSSIALEEKGQFERQPMARKPVSVIKGDSPGEWRRFYELAVAAGRGTDEEREAVTSYLAGADQIQLRLQTQQLKLSENSRLVVTERSWHNVQWYEPDVIANEVKWCLAEHARLDGKGLGSGAK